MTPPGARGPGRSRGRRPRCSAFRTLALHGPDQRLHSFVDAAEAGVEVRVRQAIRIRQHRAGRAAPEPEQRHLRPGDARAGARVPGAAPWRRGGHPRWDGHPRRGARRAGAARCPGAGRRGPRRHPAGTVRPAQPEGARLEPQRSRPGLGVPAPADVSRRRTPGAARGWRRSSSDRSRRPAGEARTMPGGGARSLRPCCCVTPSTRPSPRQSRCAKLGGRAVRQATLDHRLQPEDRARHGRRVP